MPEMLPDATSGQGCVHKGAQGAFSFVRPPRSSRDCFQRSDSGWDRRRRVISDRRIQDSGLDGSPAL